MRVGMMFLVVLVQMVVLSVQVLAQSSASLEVKDSAEVPIVDIRSSGIKVTYVKLSEARVLREFSLDGAPLQWIEHPELGRMLRHAYSRFKNTLTVCPRFVGVKTDSVRSTVPGGWNSYEVAICEHKDGSPLGRYVYHAPNNPNWHWTASLVDMSPIPAFRNSYRLGR